MCVFFPFKLNCRIALRAASPETVTLAILTSFQFLKQVKLVPISEPLHVLFPLPGMLFPLCREASQWALTSCFHLITTVISFLLPIPGGDQLLTCLLPRGLSPHETILKGKGILWGVSSVSQPLAHYMVS